MSKTQLTACEHALEAALQDYDDQDFDGLVVGDLVEIRHDYTGQALHINDHGNVTLYAVRNGKLREIASRV